LGVPIYIADLEARTITNHPETLQLIEQQFGLAVIQSGQLNREAMADLVFNNPEKLQQLNAIIHPLVSKHFQEWLKVNENAVYVIKEAAILFETNNHLSCDFVITVTAPLEVKIVRVQKRDNSSRQEIENRIKNQWMDAERIVLSDFVINNEEFGLTRKQVQKIDVEIRKLSK
jgi:dephospho-CoA kinase